MNQVVTNAFVDELEKISNKQVIEPSGRSKKTLRGKKDRRVYNYVRDKVR